jgi:WD40 repeat protein
MNSPFKFLDSYTLADRSIFFGRDQEITELYRRVFQSKILLVYGISGTGKSSLVNCGLASRFEDSDWLPVNIRRGNNIVESLEEAFSKQAFVPFKKNQSVSERLQSIYLDHFKPVYLIFDQFEELFVFGSQHEKAGFIKVIKEISETKIQCSIIFIIREEFLAGMTEFENDLSDIFANRYRVEKMKRANAISAVEGPCKVFGIETEKGFSEELVDKLCPSGNEIELTYLQIYLDRIFRIAVDEKKDGAPLMFSKGLLTRAGSVSNLLGQFLDEQIREMDNPETGMAILKSFVSVQGTKKQMVAAGIQESLRTFGIEMAEPDLIKYLNRFVDLRILRERDEAGHFELRHDALAAKIYENFSLAEKELLEVRLFIENAYQTFSTRKNTLSREDLDYIEPFEKRLFLSPVLNKFLSDSKDKLQSQQRALRRLTTLVALAFLIIVAAGIQFYINKKGYTRTKELTTLALLQEKVDPLTSINTAFKILEKDSVSTVVQGIILSSFNKLLQEKLAADDTSLPKELLPRKIPVTGEILSMRLNKAGTHIFGWTDFKEVFTCGVGDSIVQSFIFENEIITVEVSPDAKHLAVVYKNSMGTVLTIDGKKIFDFETTVNPLMNNRLIRFFSSGKYFMAGVHENESVIFDSTGSIIFTLEGHTGRVNSIDISPDNRFIATASCDKKVIIWNFNHKTCNFSPYDTLFHHNDTVWSCEFNHTGKYILTASADSTLQINKLDGSKFYNWFFLAKNSRPDGTVWWWSAEHSKKFDTTYSFLNLAYNRRIFDASFSSNHRAIIASNYKFEKMDARNPIRLSTTQVIYYDFESGGYIISPYANILLKKSKSSSSRLGLYQSWEIAPDMNTFAAFSGQNETIKLFAADGYRLANIAGCFPKFSDDGKFLFFVKNKTIHKLPLSQKEIYSLVFRIKLFGNPNKGNDIVEIL